MTESEWLAEVCPSEKLKPTRVRSARKLRLLAVACCRRIGHLIPADCRPGIAVSERFADGSADTDELSRAHATAAAAMENAHGPCREYRVMAKHSAMAVFGATLARKDLGSEVVSPERFWLGGALVAVRWHAHLGTVADHKAVRYAAYKAEEFAQSRLVEDIFGNPFRPVTLDPLWQSETVVALASAIYADRAFDRMPILADALEEAGCDHADMLAHCRGDGPHVRGCWVVDLVLGKS